MLNTRCSRLPLIAHCPASSVPPAVRIETAGVEARLGTAVHEGLAAHVAGRPWDAHRAALQHGVDVEELLALVFAGQDCWEKVRELFPDPKTEAYMEWADPQSGLLLTGHADVMSVVEVLP